MFAYWAHSDPNGLPEDHPAARWQRLDDHLIQVGELAARYAREAKPADTDFIDIARAAGLLHDLGKFSKEFQELIRGVCTRRAPHAALGAAIARRQGCYEAAFAICGHHSGLPDPNTGPSSLVQRTKFAMSAAEALWREAKQHCHALALCDDAVNPLLKRTTCQAPDVRIRMLFSCLVDADRSDTAAFAGRFPARPAKLNAEARLARLLEFIERRAATVPDGVVRSARQSVLAACLEAASEPLNLFSLTVPTGGGKTLASMAFALKRASLFPGRFRRIIVVIPYLSIIEQNAQVYIDALGQDAILEHHSGDIRSNAGVNNSEEGYSHSACLPATENWDAPIIVTTSVQFFDSLFSNQPGDLRRLHNIARSIVILDEVQTLPPKVLVPALSMMQELAQDWDVTFLFCTATQPAFERQNADGVKDRRWAPGTIHEVVPDRARLFEALKRVRIEWRERSPAWDDIASEMVSTNRALCIVNTKRHAVELFQRLEQHAGPEGVYHLSTAMCPKHRLQVLGEIRNRLESTESACLVVSTQLVEAGVDLDFPVVFRAVGPLDSIVQAAGRCDREGVLTAAQGKPAGRLIVFEPEDPRTPGGVYEKATALTRALRLTGDRPDDIQHYFNRLYLDANIGDLIEDCRRKLKFAEVARECRIIDEDTEPVFVPYDDHARSLIQELHSSGILHLELRRALQRYTVSLRRWEIATARRGAIYEVGKGTGIWICVEGFYDSRLGLRFGDDPLPAFC